MSPSSPDGLPFYRELTGKDDAAFCHRVSEALAMWCRLCGSPALCFNGERVVVAQALLWADNESQKRFYALTRPLRVCPGGAASRISHF